ncbi:MerR family transcriptional regulator [Viridibacillus arvi]|uniref:MerR family transcriptional regulator n=1 Tax=Viridibacillus arvi TaxID=263475 RepID=UPI0036E4EE60
MAILYTIKQAAEKVSMTSETLRHYDRIGLVKPCHKDEQTGYRYYSDQELVQLQTIELLKTMDLNLMEIKDILQQNELPRIISLLKQAEKKADEKIARLQYAKSRIKRAYTNYENKLNSVDNQNGEFFVKHLSERVIMLSDKLEYPTIKNLSNYHNHFYKQIEEELQPQFLFEDMAGMYTTPEKTRLFTICLKYPSIEGLTILPEGNYLCANCTEENKDMVLQKLLQKAKTEFGVSPDVVLHCIVIVGVLQWNYQIQLLIQ